MEDAQGLRPVGGRPSKMRPLPHEGEIIGAAGQMFRQHVGPVDFQRRLPDKIEMEKSRAIRRCERLAANMGREAGKPGQGVQPRREFLLDVAPSLPRDDASEKCLPEETAGDPFDIEFEMLDQIPAFCALEQRLWQQGPFRMAIFEIFENDLRFREGAAFDDCKYTHASIFSFFNGLSFQRFG
jgi:hypothetical protein